MIVSLNDFKGEANIPGMFPAIGDDDVLNEVVQKEVLYFIEKYEPVYLFQFFNCLEKVEEIENYNSSENKTDEEKNKLIETFKLTIPLFVAYHYFEEKSISNTSVGANIPKTENSTKTNNKQRMCFIWNQMVELTRLAVCKFGINSCKKADIFHFINEFGI